MAKILSLDWDNREFHLVEATLGRGKARVHRAISWREDEPFSPAKAEEFGSRLHARLKAAGIGAAPLIVALGRDRVVVREVRFPQVSPEVEAAVVRNQVIKDLTESPDDVLFDYVPLTEPSRSGERRALSLVVRKEMINALQTACRAAGLKLVAVTARPFGIAACFKNLAGATPQVPAPPAPDAVTAVLTVSGDWAEFNAMRGEQLLFSRSMISGEALLGEVRRNLAAYSGQPQLSFPRDAIQALYVAGNGENALLREKLQATLGIPVHGMDPFALEERVDVDAGNRAGFAGAVGLLQTWAAELSTPINFVKPRESRPAASPVRRRALLYGSLGTVAAALLIYGGFTFVNASRADEIQLEKKKAELEKRLKGLQVETKYLDALTEWEDLAIPFLDEIYDLAARAPFTKGFKVTKIVMQTVTPKAGTKTAPKAKDKTASPSTQRYTGQMNIDLWVEASKTHLIPQFINAINADREQHVRCTEKDRRTQKSGSSNSWVECKLQVDIVRQPPTKYTTLISR